MVDIRTLSASALKNWESCPAYAGATSLYRIPSERGPAADLGTAVHAALEFFVKGVFIEKTVPNSRDLLLKLFHEAYEGLFGSDVSMYGDGYSMLKDWYDRQDWAAWAVKKILSTEVKENFEIKTTLGQIPFNYIWDRADQLGPDEYEIIDYKSWRWARKHDDMKRDIQVRCYALAGQIKWPKAGRIWVTLDQIRYDQISVAFTRDENLATWNFIKRCAREIIAASDPLEERVNSNCRFCPRKSNCETLLKHVAVGGDLGIDNVGEAARLSYEVKSRLDALKTLQDQLDGFMTEWFQRTDTDRYEDDDFIIEMGSGPGRRSVDADRAATVIGHDLFDRYGKKSITVAAVDSLLKGKEIDDETKARLSGLITKGFSGGSKPSVTRKGSIDKD